MQKLEIPKEEILARECRFVVFCENRHSEHDLHLVKEIVHTKDGRKIPRVVKFYDFKRDFYVSMKGHRTFTQPKEWEDVSRLKKYSTTQSHLSRSIAKALGNPGFVGNPRELYKSPYLFGADILSTALIKAGYMHRWPEVNTPFSVAALDTEKSMTTNKINMATLSFKEKVFTAIDRHFFEGYTDIENRLHQAMMKYLGDYVKKRNIHWEIKLVDNDAEVVVECLRKVHEYQPDFTAIWNMNFDIPLMAQTLKDHHIDPARAFSDPSVESEFKFFFYRQGPNKKVTDSGKVMPLKPAEQWHTLYTPASTYFIDAMCVYQKLRIAEGSEPSYSLDAILQKELGIRKLKFKEADHLHKAQWHTFMQEKYPFEYVIYNTFDCISMEELDEKTGDLSVSLPIFAGFSDFANFKSQPRRLVDKLHFECLKRNKVIGCTSSELKSEADKETIPLTDLIVALPIEQRINTGLQCIEENPLMRTNIYAFAADLDISSAYPTNESICNMSKETTRKELVGVEGKEWSEVKMQALNLSGGYTNAVEVCTELLNLPRLDTLLEAFEKSTQ